MLIRLTLAIVLISLVTSSAIRNEEQHDKRTKEKELSDLEHEQDGEHNAEYDHEAFLGREEAHTFDQLTPEQSIQKLGEIVGKIDSNKDGVVEEEEMIAWIKYIQKSYVSDDAKRQWEYHEKNDGDVLSWEDYHKTTFGHLAEEQLEDNDDNSDGFSYKEMMTRDERRFKKADINGDGHLTFYEFIDFLHPEDAEHMREIVVSETMEDIDKDGDGFIDEKEYIGDMWPQGSKEEAEPEWVATEREHFDKWRDLNHDGKMDEEEVKHWIMPDDYDHAMAESKHLIYEADADKDGKLTKEEILQKYDLFVGSQATDFGEALTKSHDEF